MLLINQANALPLDPKAVKSVAVVGPFGDGSLATEAMLGGYTPGNPRGGVVTITAAFKARCVCCVRGLSERSLTDRSGGVCSVC